VLPTLINARLTEPAVAAAHDLAYCGANCPTQADATTLGANRTRLMLTFLTDVLVLGEHASLHASPTPARAATTPSQSLLDMID
jgi:hypothetical protein